MGLVLSLQYSPEASDVIVNVDEDKFSQAMTNLIGNALKFTPSGGRVTLSVRHAQTSQNAVVSVTDTGVGMSEVRIFRCMYKTLHVIHIHLSLQENLGKLFQGEVQFSPGTLQQGGGAGWGLYSK